MKVITIPIVAALATAMPAFGQQVVAVRGEIQIWQRSCETADRCEGLFTASDRLPVAASLSRPTTDSELSAFSEIFTFLSTKVVFQTFWRLGNDTDSGYLTHQISLSTVAENNASPVARCTSYLDIESVSFPVGACTGFHPTDQGFTQYGVTLWQASSLP